MRRFFIVGVILIIAFHAVIAAVYPPVLYSLLIFGPLIILGFYDFFQTKKAILRNFPILGHFRYLMEAIRPEIRQYFIESDTEGMPFGRDERSVIYQRAKNVRDTVAFGTMENVYAAGYEWVNHSLNPQYVDPESLRVTIGGPQCEKPYSASVLNISAMSFGSLSNRAVRAMGLGAKMGGFAQNTGEGGLSPHHDETGADLIWQIGTGYFGCRDEHGNFDPELFRTKAVRDNVKMIEIKLSQGAKPGHGGILPAAKLTKEIAEIRHVPMGRDVNSPPAHTAFSTPTELMYFVKRLRELSGGKPIGFKLCVGNPFEFAAICKAMIATDIAPDFITVDGGEGGTGAAPLEFTNHIGTPMVEGLVTVHNLLKGFGLRGKVRIIVAGKVSSGFSLVKRLALGADVCYSARAMMMATGCIQAMKCNTNHCPVGVATQDAALIAGLNVADKSRRVASYHRQVLHSLAEMLGAMNVSHPGLLRPRHILRRNDDNTVRRYDEIFSYIESGSLQPEGAQPEPYAQWARLASADSFAPADQFD